MLLHQIHSKEGAIIQAKKTTAYKGEEPICFLEISINKEAVYLTNDEVLELIELLNFNLKDQQTTKPPDFRWVQD